jgi:repressor LexA
VEVQVLSSAIIARSPAPLRGAMTTSRDRSRIRAAMSGVRQSLSPRPRAEDCEPAFLTPSAAVATVIEHMFVEGDQVLTERQRQILDFLTKYADAHGYPPTVREIGEAVGLASPSTVHAHLANLERAGLLKRDPTKPRAIELRREPKAPAVAETDVHKLPLVGEVAAGGPLLAEDNVEGYLAVPEPLSRGGEEFLLRVKGDSMINAGILDGDIAVVERAQDAQNGDIVVALAGDDETTEEATLKRLFKEDGRVRLQPENDALEPIFAQHVQLIGKVIGVVRQL